VAHRPLQRRLHPHVAQLGDGEVEVLDGGVAFVRLLLTHLLGHNRAPTEVGALDMYPTGERLPMWMYAPVLGPVLLRVAQVVLCEAEHHIAASTAGDAISR